MNQSWLENDMTKDQINKETVSEYYTRCFDCGRFVEKKRWVKKNNPYRRKGAICYECYCNYDPPEY